MENQKGWPRPPAIDGIKSFNNATKHCSSSQCFAAWSKTINSIDSRRPWPPLLISHLFQSDFFSSWPLASYCFYTQNVLVGISLHLVRR